MSTHFSIPAIDSEKSVKNKYVEDFEIDLTLPDNIVNKLTDLVRSQYFSYIEKLLYENYSSCSKINENIEISLASIQKSATYLEQCAARSCMVVQFYRKTALKIIAEIRRETECGKLFPELDKFGVKCLLSNKNNKKTFIDSETQTENKFLEAKNQDLNMCGIYQIKHKYLSLQEKVNIFEEKLDDREKCLTQDIKVKQENKEALDIINPNRFDCINQYEINSRFKRKFHNSKLDECNRIDRKLTKNTPLKLSPVISNAPINKPQLLENDSVAKELDTLFGNESERLEDEIFGEGIYNPEVESILKEIEQASIPNEIESKDSQTNSMKPNSYRAVLFNLSESLWPCELHMRQQKLREILLRLADKGLRYHQSIKNKFLAYFGEDSDDEFALYSPSELDEELIGSCKKRIAPWVVKYLMKPLNEGLISNRYLFKKLAKKLTYTIILDNQYPDEKWIQQAVDDFFCFRPQVNSIEDIEIC